MNAWRSMSATTRRVVAVVGVLVALNLLFNGLRTITGGDPGGPTSSSYATGDDGMAAYAQLLRDAGHDVTRLRTPVREAATVGPDDTLVVADPDRMGSAEAEAVARFVRDGGRLVALGPRTAPALRRLLGTALDWSARPVHDAAPIVVAPEVASVSSVRAGGRGSWRHSAAGLPILADSEAVLALVADVGRGRVVAVADASVLHNALLDDAGNAAFGLAAAGEVGRAVHFAEAVHGFGPTTGLGALPSRWKWALLFGAVAGLGWMWSKGRRFGPPDELARELPPPRRAYVDAMAASLSKVKRPNDAVAPLQHAARARIARRAGLAPAAGVDEIRAAARRLGLDEDEIEAVTTVPVDDDEIMAAGRALARLEGSTW